MVVSESVYCQIVFSLMFSVKNCLKDKTPYRMCVCVFVCLCVYVKREGERDIGREGQREGEKKREEGGEGERWREEERRREGEGETEREREKERGGGREREM